MRTICAIFRFVAVLAALLFPQLASAGQLAPKAETRVRAIDIVVETGLKATSLCDAETRSAEEKFAVKIASRSPIHARGGAGSVNPRLTDRLAAWKRYKETYPHADMQTWVRQTNANPSWGSGVSSGYGQHVSRVKRLFKIEGHHSDPKFMGGNPGQPLTDMSGLRHTELHQELYRFLEPRGMAPRAGFGGPEIQQLHGVRALRRTMADFYKGPGSRFADAAGDFFRQHPGLKCSR